MPDSLVALRTALADAWLGDTHEARAVFGSGEAAKVFDKRLIDLLLGLGQGATTDPASISGADIAGLLREISAISQADRIAFIQAIKNYMANTFVASSPLSGIFLGGRFYTSGGVVAKTFVGALDTSVVSVSKVGPDSFAFSGAFDFDFPGSDTGTDALNYLGNLAYFEAYVNFPLSGIFSDFASRVGASLLPASAGFGTRASKSSGSRINTPFAVLDYSTAPILTVRCPNLNVAYINPDFGGPNGTVPPSFQFNCVANLVSEAP